MPLAAVECRLIRHGQVVQEWRGVQHCSYITSQPGAYRTLREALEQAASAPWRGVRRLFGGAPKATAVERCKQGQKGGGRHERVGLDEEQLGSVAPYMRDSPSLLGASNASGRLVSRHKPAKRSRSRHARIAKAPPTNAPQHGLPLINT